MRITAPVLGLFFCLSCPLLAQLTITTNSLPFGGVDQDYNVTLQSSGGLDDLQWSFDSGTLPPGVNFDPPSAGLFGNPTAGGTYTFTIRLTDPSLNQTTTKKFSIGILQISTQAQLPDANTCVNYSQQLQVSDGPAPPYTWTTEDGLPPSGLNLDQKSGLLSGRPTTPGSYFFTVQVTNPNTKLYAFKNFSLNVASLCFITTSLPNGDVGSFYRQSLVISGGVSPFAWVVDSGALPAGMES